MRTKGPPISLRGASERSLAELLGVGKYARADVAAVAPQDDSLIVLPRDAVLVGSVRDPGGEVVPSFEVQVIPRLDWDYYERRFRDADFWKRFDSAVEEFRVEELWSSPVRVHGSGALGPEGRRGCNAASSVP